MISSVFSKKNIIDQLRLISLFFFPLLISCSSNQNNVVEIITPPIFPKEFSSIPKETEKPQLLSLLSVQEKIKDIDVGRKDPFLPPNLVGEKLLVPTSFIYHGQISSANQVNAFVTYEDRKGTIKQGDIGGKSTNLLPQGWIVKKIDLNTQSLILSFDSSPVKIDLFPMENP